MTTTNKLPVMVQVIDDCNSLTSGIDLPFRIDTCLDSQWLSKNSDFGCSIVKTRPDNLKLKEIWVEWMETHWLMAMSDRPAPYLKKGDVYVQETSRLARRYTNETFAKSFVMSLALGQKTTADLKASDYEVWDGYNPKKDNIFEDRIVAVRLGSYPDMSDERFEYLVDRYLDISPSQKRDLKPNRLIIMNYYFETGAN